MMQTALSEMDKVFVLIYDDPIINIPLKTRADWIRKIYPEVEVIEGYQSPNDSGYTPEIMKIQEAYVLKMLNGQKCSHFYSSEHYGKHVSEALNADNRLVDFERKTIPISATKIRADLFENRDFIHPIVYRDLITKVVFLGAESTGKSTIAAHLAKHFDTQFLPEYGKEYWEKYQIDGKLTLQDLVRIAKTHLKREDDLILKSNNYLFSDTNAITTYLFSLDYHGSALPELTEFARIAEKRHDIIFLCDTDISYEDTWDRSGIIKRAEFQKKIIADLIARNLKYHLIKGNLNERTKQIKEILSKPENRKF